MTHAMEAERAVRAIDLDAVNADLDQADPLRIIRWSVETFAPRLGVSSSFGAESACLLHLVVQVWPQAPVLFINTGFLFEETLAFRDQLVERLGLNVVEFRPQIPTGQFLAERGELWKTDPDACCAVNKVEPMQRAVEGYDAWMSGIRRDQSSARADTPIVRRLGTGLFKISPIANWSTRQIHEHLRDNKLPYHPLYEKGYLSIGCTHCTRAVGAGGDARSGRWAGQGKTECGLHTMLGEKKDKGAGI
ncbi:MAG: Phosphoadenosine phosphosulfate reductase [Phycisphaerae bacterium]|nr:Phosphoadenosine phosphosulfate reductase [Phycisphaerae bacterium]